MGKTKAVPFLLEVGCLGEAGRLGVRAEQPAGQCAECGLWVSADGLACLRLLAAPQRIPIPFKTLALGPHPPLTDRTS